jgi:3-hydroxyisobutyrate dehydrogenase/glyoxylate/succinic semialdehyde reductase
MKIGFIGLGIMGSRMAANLIGAGWELVVHNRTESRAEPLLESGARWAETPAAVAGQVDVVMTMLSTPVVVERVALGEGGFLPAMGKGAVWVDCSTVDPAFSRRMLAECSARGVEFVDAPVSGSMVPAREGELVFLVGGDGPGLSRAEPLFEAMGRKVVHAGGPGSGTGLKMVVNLLLGSSMAAFAEAVALGQSLGLARPMLVRLLVDLPVSAPFLEAKRDNFDGDTYPVEFPLKWMHKDLHLAAKTAYEQDLPLVSTNAVKEVFALAEARGLSDEDFSAVLKSAVAAGRIEG